MKELFCRAIISDNKNIIFSSVTSEGSTLQEIIQDDKQYGKMIPRNGKYFTYAVFDWQNKWITQEQITKGVTIAWNMIEKVIKIKCQLAKINEIPDFKVYFKRLADDATLTKNTLMYHYFPINDFNNTFRGVCVVNADYTWTSDGEGIPLHIYDPIHYPKPVTAEAETFDFDATYQHEAIHGVGLPHSPHYFKKMSPRYDIMAESIFDESDDETILRLQAKYEKMVLTGSGKFKGKILDNLLLRWINYFRLKRDNY